MQYRDWKIILHCQLCIVVNYRRLMHFGLNIYAKSILLNGRRHSQNYNIKIYSMLIYILTDISILKLNVNAIYDVVYIFLLYCRDK